MVDADPRITRAHIKAGTRVIGANAFYCCQKLISVRLPDSITAIEDYAFAWCYHLTSIRMSPNAAFIGKDAFLDFDDFQFIHCSSVCNLW